MSDQGYNAYQTAQNSANDPRDVEYRLLAKVTAGLLKAKDDMSNTKLRVEAALYNREVWSALRLDLSDENNQLPKELRASLISISLWIERETTAVLDNEGDIDALIEVNQNIMAGLKPEKSSDGPDDDTPPSPPSSLESIL